MVELEPHEQGVVVPVKARAGARRNGVTGTRQGRLYISVTQAPEKGKANKAIAGELAEALGVRPADVRLFSGETSPKKRFLIVGVTAEAILERLQVHLQG